MHHVSPSLVVRCELLVNLLKILSIFISIGDLRFMFHRSQKAPAAAERSEDVRRREPEVSFGEEPSGGVFCRLLCFTLLFY